MERALQFIAAAKAGAADEIRRLSPSVLSAYARRTCKAIYDEMKAITSRISIDED